MNIRKAGALAVLAIVFSSQLSLSQDVTVAAAADLQFALRDVAARFQKETGKKISASYGSSGNFYQQIQNGDPFDLFFSADLEHAKKLGAAGLTGQVT
jgi:molybdate transport system substrate-binding protein